MSEHSNTTPETATSGGTAASDASTNASGRLTTTLRPRRELVAWRNAIFVIFALSGLSIATWVARLPAIRDSLGISTGEIGLLILGMSIGSIVGLIAAPPVLGRLGPRRGMATSLSIVAAGLVFIGIGSSLVPMAGIVLIGLILFGFGNGSVDVMMNVEGAAAEHELGKTVLPLMHACFSFGTVIGAGIGAVAASLALPVFIHAIVMAAVIAGTAVVAVRYVPIREPLADEAHEGSGADAGSGSAGRGNWRQRLLSGLSVWADVRLVFIGVIMLGMAFAEGSANDWLTIAVVDGHLQTQAVGALVFGAFVSAMTIGRVVGGPLIDRFGRVIVLQVSAGAAVVGLSTFILAEPTWLMIAGAVLWGLGCSLGFPVGMSAAADDPRRAAARVSAVAMIGYCAFLVGPPAIGLLADHVGILNALFVVLVLIVLAGLASPAAREASRRVATA
ncbi:MFS transporter [Plantibacter sp. Mn2098]|uniref:MFS transporter n=1 Tax=Plantibacter sp. Mn2098 TaxID=3395266 RepID=UPI003BC0D40D